VSSGLTLTDGIEQEVTLSECLSAGEQHMRELST